MNFSKTDSNLAIIIGGYVNCLGLVRSLASLNQKIIVVTTQPYDIAHRSKYVGAHYHISRLDLFPERLSGLLLQHAKEWKGAVVIPTNDEAISSLGLFHDTLDPWFQPAIPPLESIPYVLDKSKMLQAARIVGMQLPLCYGPASESGVSDQDFSFPVVVKPVKASEFSAKFGEKLFVANNSLELQNYCRLLKTSGSEGEVFDLVPGPDSSIYAYCVYVDQHCDPVAECTIRKLRQTPPFLGIARVAELTGNIPLIREQSMELIRHIGFRGLAVLEFKKDARDGTFRFFEINGRSVLYNSLLRKANLDVAKLIWSDYGEGRVKKTEPAAWPGVWIHLHADILRTLQNFRREQLSIKDYLRPYGRQKTFAVWSRHDPKPFCTQWSSSLRGAGSIFLNKLKHPAGEGDF